MRARIVNFTRRLDPKAAMGTGARVQIKQWFDDLNINPNNYIINPDLSVEYKENLNLSNTPITSLPNNLSVEGGLDLRNTLITRLPDNLSVGGYLDLSNTPITSLPKSLKVKGTIFKDF